MFDKLKRMAGFGKERESPGTQSKSNRTNQREPAKRTIISPEEQIALDQRFLAQNLEAIAAGKALLSHSDPKEVKRGRWMIGFNYTSTTPRAYCIGQIKWRLGLGDPSDDLEAAVKYYAALLQDCKQYGAETNVYWAHLVAFVCVILSGSVPPWVAQTLPDQSSIADSKTRLKPWEINLGYQFALARSLPDGTIPPYWPRFLSDSAGRAGLKRIRQNIETYERLYLAARKRDWETLVSAVEEVDTNYRKRGSSEASHADVFGDGPFNSRSIDYIAAAILRTVQYESGFPGDRISTSHLWKWGNRDLSHLAPKL